MLFYPSNQQLSKPSFYRALHHQLGPLKGPLLASSDKVPQITDGKGVFDLIFDPATLTVHTSLPNIPEPVANPGLDLNNTSSLPRTEALHVHSQIIRIIEDTRWKDIPLGLPSGERERTNRTTRGWWIAWMRLEGVETQPKPAAIATTSSTPATSPEAAETSANDPQTDSTAQAPEDDIASFIGSVNRQKRGRREAFIIRKGSEHQRSRSAASKDLKSGFGIPIKLTEGLGIDTKRYFDQLLNLTSRT